MGGERTSTKRMTHTQQTGGEGGKMQSKYATERLEDETGGEEETTRNKRLVWGWEASFRRKLGTASKEGGFSS